MYRAKPVTQRDGSPLQFSNCLMATAAVGLDFHTLGDKTSTGSKMRNYSGDTSGGTNTDEVLRAWDRGYEEVAKDRDGDPWDRVMEDLWAGRLVMLQVWAATMGSPCLSGEGFYGHGIAVAPEQRVVADGSRQWLMADPWCKPPKWVWWDQSALKAGAERWSRKVAAEAGGPVGELPLKLIKAAARRLMERWDPEHPAPHDPPEVGGGEGILYAVSKPHPDTVEVPAGDVSINMVDGLTSPMLVKTKAGIPFYGDAARKQKLGTLGDSAKDRVFIGTPVGSGSRAIVVNTSAPYDDGVDRETIVYVKASDAGDPHSA